MTPATEAGGGKSVNEYDLLRHFDDLPASWASTLQPTPPRRRLTRRSRAASQKGIEKIEKCLVYAPDAIGTVRYEADPDAFARKITEAIPSKDGYPAKRVRLEVQIV